MDSNVPQTSIPIHPRPLSLETEALPSQNALIVSKPSTPFKPAEPLPLQSSAANDLLSNTLTTMKEMEAETGSTMPSFFPALPSAMTVTRFNESQVNTSLTLSDTTPLNHPDDPSSFLMESNTGDAFLNDFFAYNFPGFASQSNLIDPSLFNSVNLMAQPLPQMSSEQPPSVQQQPPSQPQLPQQIPATFVAMPVVATPTPPPSASATMDVAKTEMNGNKKKRHKRPRNSFNESQKRVLDDFFDHQSHTPTRSQKLQLAKQLNSTERTVTVWFQNRRQKLVKISRMGGDVQANDPSQAVKAMSVKPPKSAATTVGVSKKRKLSQSHYLSPPMQPTESPFMTSYYAAAAATTPPPHLPPPSYVPPMMLPNTPSQTALAPPPASTTTTTTTTTATNPAVSYAMYANAGFMDSSHPYMLSPVTPTFNPYAMYHPHMRNFQLNAFQTHAPSPTPPFASHLLQPPMQPPSQLPQQQAMPLEMLLEYNHQSLVFQPNTNASVKAITAPPALTVTAIPNPEFNSS